MHPAAMINHRTYHNPVFGHDFPDPFVLKFCGEYWAYCTGVWQDGRIFGILRSRDLVKWQQVGGAMEPLPGSHPCYWAPEVTYDNGRFYLYYSVGDETNMHIRVAVADHPAGPFTDQGVCLTQEPFAIDAHLFTDGDGARYLFYATDFLERERVGTGTVMDRLLDPFTLAGQPRPVSRARYDWQIYDPQRQEKGGVRWHTLEGSFVIKRKSLYYQMFSGGNWQNPSYGVGYAITPTIERADEWEQLCDGKQVLPILRTIPDQVIGPGHNSVVRGPDNRQLYCVYHRWEGGNGRQLAIDPLDFAGKRMLILGPTYTPRPAPQPPTFIDYFEGETLNEKWQSSGPWRLKDGVGVVLGDSGQTAVLSYDVSGLPFLAEVSARALTKESGEYGLCLYAGETQLFQLRLSAGQGCARLVEQDGCEQMLPLPPDFRCDVFHLLRLELYGRNLSLCLDDHSLSWEGTLTKVPAQLALLADQTTAVFAGFALTVGWQDDFDTETSPDDLKWVSDQPADWSIHQQQFTFTNPNGKGVVEKGPYLAAYELVVNARLESGSEYGIAPAQTAAGEGPLFIIIQDNLTWIACWQDGKTIQRYPLPNDFDAGVYQQFRFRKKNGRLAIHWEQHEITVVPVTTEPTRIGLYGRSATATFDMVRVTAVKA